MIKAPVFSILLGWITLLFLLCVSRLKGVGVTKTKIGALQKNIYTHGLYACRCLICGFGN